MKKYLIATLLFTPYALLAQTMTSSHSMRSGDEMRRSVVYVPDCSQEGEGAVWNLQDMIIMDNDIVTYCFGLESAPGLVTCFDRYACQRYNVDDEGICLSERHTATSHVKYDIPETMMLFPMHFRDSIHGIYGGVGTYCDKLFVREYGSYLTKLDASGCMVLPDGDTLRNVYRLTTERLVYCETAPVDSMRMVFGDSIPRYTPDSVFMHMRYDAPINKVREQRWYADGYRYPILETTECRSVADGRYMYGTAIFFPSEAQASQLPYDGDNEQARLMAERGSEGNGKGANERREVVDPIASFSMSQDHDASTVTITYSLNASASLRVVLASTMGVVYSSAEQANEPGTDYSLTLSYNGLPHGQYIVFISAGGFTHTAKFNVL